MGVLSIYVVAFLVISVYLTASLRSSEEDMFRSTALNVGVIDQDRSDASRALTGFLAARHKVIPMEADPEKNNDDLFYRYADYILTIPEGFEEKLAAAGGDRLLYGQALPSSSASVFLDSQIDEYLRAVTLRLSLGKDLNTAMKSASEAINDLPKVKTLKEKETGKEATTQPVWYYFRYLPYILINVLVLGVGAVLTALHDDDFERRVRISSIRMNVFRRHIVEASIVYALIVWAIFFAFSQITYPGEISGRPLLLSALNTGIFTLVSLSVAVFASAIARGPKRSRTNILNMISNTLSLAMSFFCGIFIPLEFLGKGVKTVAHFLPAFWYIELNTALSGAAPPPPTFAAKCILLQLAFAALFFALASLLSRRKTR